MDSTAALRVALPEVGNYSIPSTKHLIPRYMVACICHLAPSTQYLAPSAK